MIDDNSDLSQQSSDKNSCIYSTIILDYNQDELVSNQINENMSFNQDKPKNKRQRLNNLTQDEKLIRRKLKNRVAAQNARDRKKAKMEYLEKEIHILKEQNKSLKKENHLLKEKSKILMDENKRLTKYKEIVDSSQLSIGINEYAKQEDEKLCIEVVRSAEETASNTILSDSILHSDVCQFQPKVKSTPGPKECSSVIYFDESPISIENSYSEDCEFDQCHRKTQYSLKNEGQQNKSKINHNLSAFEEVNDEENATLDYLLKDCENQIELVEIEKLDQMIDELSMNFIANESSEKKEKEQNICFEMEKEFEPFNLFRIDDQFNIEIDSFDPNNLISTNLI